MDVRQVIPCVFLHSDNESDQSEIIFYRINDILLKKQKKWRKFFNAKIGYFLLFSSMPIFAFLPSKWIIFLGHGIIYLYLFIIILLYSNFID